MSHEQPQPFPPGGPRRRVYRLRDAALLLVSFGLTLLLLDAEGLHSWATRMDVGPAQDLWLALVEPWRETAAAAGLTEPRRMALDAADRLGAALGGAQGTEELLARGWNVVGSPPAPLGAAAAREDSAAPTPPPPPDQTAVLLVGDSLMVTLAPAVTRAVADDGSVRVVAAHRSATGLSRPDVYDWPAVVGSFLAIDRPRLVVCAFGGNDAQDVRHEGKVLAFGSAAWDALYAARVRAMMTAMRASGAEVLWLGLPPMRPARFDARMRHLDALFEAEAARVEGVTYVPTSTVVGDASGRFAGFLRGPGGKLVRVRHDDGIHYAEHGAQLVAARVEAWIEAKLHPVAQAGKAAPAPHDR
ncbi:MAG TPA: DUF459 domain-containing protein [Anaeromyxobacter sp.]|nr:DUF459 domain-containing protein [Anaeromyxobacter sp.]